MIENIVQDAATTFIMVTIRTELPSVGHVQPVRSYGVFVLVILRVRPISIKSVFVRRIVGMRKVAAITLLIQPNFRRLDTGNKITLWRRDLTSTNSPMVARRLAQMPLIWIVECIMRHFTIGRTLVAILMLFDFDRRHGNLK